MSGNGVASPPVLTVDTSRWPLVVLTYAGQHTEAQLAEHLREVEEKVLGRRERFVQIIDQSRGEMPDALQRAVIADHQSRMEELYRQHCLGEAYVTSPRLRGAMVAVFWMAKPPYPYTFVSTLLEALKWAHDRLKDAGLVAG